MLGGDDENLEIHDCRGEDVSRIRSLVRESSVGGYRGCFPVARLFHFHHEKTSRSEQLVEIHGRPESSYLSSIITMLRGLIGEMMGREV